MTTPIRLVNCYKNPDTGRWFVIEWASYDLAVADTEWMDDALVGKHPLVPNPDLVHVVYEVGTETEAMEKVAALYAQQLVDRANAQLNQQKVLESMI